MCPPSTIRQAARALLLGMAISYGPARAGEIGGVVLGVGERPLPQAAVTLVQDAGMSRSIRADARGRFSFSDVAPGWHVLIAHSNGYAAQYRWVSVEAPAHRPKASFRLQRWQDSAWSVTGTVLSEDGKLPIPLATLMVISHSPVPGALPDGEAATNPQGRFGVSGLHPGRYQVNVQAEGYLPAAVPLLVEREGARVTLEVTLSLPPDHTRPGILRGRLQERGGAPLSRRGVGLTLTGRVVRTSAPWGGTHRRNSSGGAGAGIHGTLNTGFDLTTDSQGGFRFTVPPGTYTLHATVAGLRGGTATVSVPAGGVSEVISVGLEPGQEPPAADAARPAGPEVPPPGARGQLRGTVLQPDGTPLAHRLVYLFARRPDAGYEQIPAPESEQLAAAGVFTDAAGRFEKRDIPTGSFLVAAKTQGYAETEPLRVEVPPRGAAEVKLRLTAPATRASGRVVSAEGRPMAWALVLAYRPASPETAQYPWMGLWGGWGPRQDTGPWRSDAPAAEVRLGGIPGLLKRGLHYTETDADGRFVLPELDPGTYHFRASVPGYAYGWQRDVKLDAAAAGPQVTLTLQPLGATEGTVLTPEGTPYRGAEVSLSSPFEASEHQDYHGGPFYTDAGGRFHVPGIAAGTHSLRIESLAYPAHDHAGIVVTPGETTTAVVIRLAAGLSLRGRVLKADGTPAAGQVVRWEQFIGGRGEHGEVPAALDGTFVVGQRAAGEVRLTARAPGQASQDVIVTLPQQQGAITEVRLRPLATVHGTVRDQDGKPLPDARVYIHDRRADGPWSRGAQFATADAVGRYRIEGVTRGEVVVGAGAGGYTSASVRLDLVGRAADTPLDLILVRPRYGRVRGRVLRADGRPAVGASVRMGINGDGTSPGTDAMRYPQPIRTDAQGTFRFERLPPGRGWLRVDDRTMAREPQQIEMDVRPDEETRLPDIHLAATGTVRATITGLERLPAGARAQFALVGVPVSPQGAILSLATGAWLYTPYIREGDMGRSPGPPGLPSESHLLGASAGVAYVAFPLGTSVDRSREQTGNRICVIEQTGSPVTASLVPAGRYRAALQWGGAEGALFRHLGPEVAVEDEGTAQVALDVPPLGRLSGRTTLMGDPQRGRERVFLHHQGTREVAGSLETKPDGSFGAVMPAGEYLATVWPEGLAGMWQRFTVREGVTTDVDLSLSRGEALRGRVEGDRPQRLYVSAESETGFGAAEISPDGSFVVEHLLPGAYTLRLWSSTEARIVEKAGARPGLEAVLSW